MQHILARFRLLTGIFRYDVVSRSESEEEQSTGSKGKAPAERTRQPYTTSLNIRQADRHKNHATGDSGNAGPSNDYGQKVEKGYSRYTPSNIDHSQVCPDGHAATNSPCLSGHLIDVPIGSRKCQDYKPTPLRTWFHISLILLLVALLGLTEFAVHTLPDGTKATAPLFELGNTSDTSDLLKRSTRQYSTLDHGKSQRSPLEPTQTPAVTTPSVELGMIKTSSFSSEVQDVNGTADDSFSSQQQDNPQSETTTTQDMIFSIASANTCTTTTWLYTKYIDTITITIEAPRSSTSSDLTPTSNGCNQWVTVTRGTGDCQVCEDDSTYYLTVGRNTVTVTLDFQATSTAAASKSPDEQGDTKPSRSEILPLISTTPTSIDLTTITLAATTGMNSQTSSPIVTQQSPATGGITEQDTKTTPKTKLDTLNGVDMALSRTNLPISITSQTTPPVATSAASTHVSESDIGDGTGSPFRSSTSRTSTSTGLSSSVIVVKQSVVSAFHSRSLAVSITGEEYLTSVDMTLLGADGKPTTVSAYLALASKTLVTLTDSASKPTGTQTLAIVQSGLTSVLVNLEGVPTETITYFWRSSARILTDSRGVPTTTVTAVIAETLSTSIMTDSEGHATKTMTNLDPAKTSPATPTGPLDSEPSNSDTRSNNAGDEMFQVYGITNGEYFIGLILPTLFATVLGIPARVLDYNAKLYQPFHALATARDGATASQSLLFQTKGPWSTMKSFGSPGDGQSLISLTGILVLLSALLVPLSTEAVRIITQGESCSQGQGNAHNCAITLGVFPIPAQIAVALLATMAFMTIVIAVLLRGWKTGVSAKSWSMSAMSDLASNQSLPPLFAQLHERRGIIDSGEVSDVLSKSRYILSSWQEGKTTAYGIVVLDGSVSSETGSLSEVPEEPKQRPVPHGAVRNRKTMPTFWLTVIGRLVAMLVMVGVLILIAIYPHYRNTGTGFTRFMDSESMGVRILFSSIGIIITIFWTSYFQCE